MGPNKMIEALKSLDHNLMISLHIGIGQRHDSYFLWKVEGFCGINDIGGV